MASGGLVQLLVCTCSGSIDNGGIRAVPDAIIPCFILQKRLNSRNSRRNRRTLAEYVAALRGSARQYSAFFHLRSRAATRLGENEDYVARFERAGRTSSTAPRASLDLRKLDSLRHKGPSLADRGVTSLRPRGCKRELLTRLKNRLGRYDDPRAGRFTKQFHRGTILRVGIAISFLSVSPRALARAA